ncbi:uncharacterized protein CTRU02_214612 [Colletotrichum truncatum]|uniref:Uncharacterized protein n=1 Tax=Colletotrichum truncatum TaxID=5467 RepID=A0ACC3YFA5_COLTU|nr:uncharacterized protein CTRU02_09560 [Colletotrichum truncatum]KAF6788242.1 hypothetical protein CTRU02_09560 [Colletotrichum truncatum]
MVSRDFFLRLPPTAAFLLLSSIFTLTQASALLPRQTNVVAYRTLDVLNWPLATPMPWLGALDRRQDSSTNTVCGYINGDPNLPATCSAGSHCAMDASASAIGCCPNGVACTTGVYTGCVDSNSATQTVTDPYIFTCQGSNVCFKNTYEGGAYQYGCGSTTQGSTVVPTATGLSTTVSITQVSGLVTKAETSSSSSSTSSSSSSSASSSSSSSSSTSSSTSSSSVTSSTPTSSAAPTSSQPPASSAPPPPPSQEAQDAALRRNGGIIGGVVTGAAIFVALISAGLWMRKRKRGNNKRTGPGLGKGPSYVKPVSNQREFTPVPGQEMFEQAGYGHPSMMPGAHGTTTSITGGRAATVPATPAESAYGGYVPGGAIPSGSARRSIEDEVPLTHRNEMEDFSRGYNDAINRNDGDETRVGSVAGRSTATTNDGGAGAGASSSAGAGANPADGADIAEERPLWQQNRRQSRNLMWM